MKFDELFTTFDSIQKNIVFIIASEYNCDTYHDVTAFHSDDYVNDIELYEKYHDEVIDTYNIAHNIANDIIYVTVVFDYEA